MIFLFLDIMRKNISCTDGLYQYAFSDISFQEPIVFIELCAETEEERDAIEKLPFAPISDIEFFKYILAMECDVWTEDLENLDLKISLNGLFDGCHNLKDISVLKEFDYTNVRDFSEMFKFCTSLNSAECGFDIINHDIIREQLSNYRVLCVGMFDGAYSYDIPDWVDRRLFKLIWYS